MKSITPETDSKTSRVQIGHATFPMVLARYAGKLEQERDEARSIAAQMRAHNGYKSNDEAIFPWENAKE